MSGCSLFFRPDRQERGTPADQGLTFEDVSIPTAGDTKLHGWFLPSAADPVQGTVLHLHGNSANITGHYRFVEWLPAAGYHVLTFDYRGFGRSPGRSTRETAISDAEAALDYLKSRADVCAERLAVFGQSIGGALAIELVARRRREIRGLVADSAFSSFPAIARHHVFSHPLLMAIGWWYPFLVDAQADPINRVADIAPTPILFMHGTADRIVPSRMSEDLFARAGDPKELWLIEDEAHCAIWATHGEEAQQRTLNFLDGAFGLAEMG